MPRAEITSVAYPALCVPRDFGVYLVRDLRQLRRCRAQLFWRYHHYEGLRIFDSDEKAFEVTAASVAMPKSELGRLLARTFDLSVTVDVEISPIGRASVSDVVAAVQKAIEVDAESFEELSARSVAWWRTALANASSVKGVIAAFDDAQKRRLT
jgi:hypothetical protein